LTVLPFFGLIFQQELFEMWGCTGIRQDD